MSRSLDTGEDTNVPCSADEDPFFGRLNDPICSAFLRGLCGDEMEFYLHIEDDVIRDVKYYTGGCEHTRRCGQAVARRAQGKTILEALGINPREIIDSEPSLAERGRHCAILAVSTLYRAIAELLLTHEWPQQSPESHKQGEPIQ